ncbi:hypothetical protein [Metalysinibacillus jejuensis]|uniref:hypothetical protein n=1 Tax=Metalysinibacillus jejuensis TaxID=914327 RepID=UPI001F2FFB08|nr:hypothetical protein [Metalysinibacillus jejuensis]
MKKKRFAALGLAVGLMAFGGTVQAGTTYSSYDFVVPEFNGSHYTGYQVKTYSGTSGDLRSSSVGGAYTVDVRMENSSGSTGTWVRSVTDNDNRKLPSTAPSGSSVRLHISNDLTTPVNVRVAGSWRSN